MAFNLAIICTIKSLPKADFSGYMANYIVAITGASGSIYGVRLVETLLEKGHYVYLLISDAGKIVMEEELPQVWAMEQGVWSHPEQVEFVDCHDLTHSIASGSTQIEAMVVAPCSMNTLAHIAHGTTANLIHRAADVTMKERRALILVPRETPLSPIHLKNMLSLAELGVHILPAMPGFYSHPKTVDDLADFIVGRILDLLKVEHNLYKRWEPQTGL